MTGIRLDQLDPTATPARDHVVPAMKDGLTVRLTLAQVLGLITDADVAALTAAGIGYDPTASGLEATDVKAALDEIVSRALLDPSAYGEGLAQAADAAAARALLALGDLATLSAGGIAANLLPDTDSSRDLGSNAAGGGKAWAQMWADNIGDPATGQALAAVYFTKGAAKAWGNSNASAVLSDSFNIGSSVDNGTGSWTYNFTAPMSNAHYTVGGTAETGARILNALSITTSGFNASVYSDAGTLNDVDHNFSVQGVLA